MTRTRWRPGTRARQRAREHGVLDRVRRLAAICTSMIAAGLAGAWIGLLCAGCFGTVLLGLRLGRQFGREQDIVQGAGPLAAEPAEPALT